MDSGYLDIQNNKMVPAIFLFLNFFFLPEVRVIFLQSLTKSSLEGQLQQFSDEVVILTLAGAVVCKSYN